MVSASEDAAEEGGGCLVLVLKETEAEDLLAASSLTALLSPDMGGHLRMGRQIQDICRLRKQIADRQQEDLLALWLYASAEILQTDCGFNFSVFPLS